MTDTKDPRDERIEFLEHQFANCYARLVESETRVSTLLAERIAGTAAVKARYREQMQSMVNQTKQLARDAALYGMLRQHLVQVWGLGIAAKGDALDGLLLEQLKRIQQPPGTPPRLAIEQPSGDTL